MFIQDLQEEDYHITHISFFQAGDNKVIYSEGGFFKKVKLILKRYFLALRQLRKIIRTDIIFLHREWTPLGYPLMELFLFRFSAARIIYDFDDAIWLRDPQEKENYLSRFRFKQKTKLFIKWADKIACGNEYLLTFSKTLNANSYLVPTVVDTVVHKPSRFQSPAQKKENITIGWTGSHTTTFYLKSIESTLIEIERDYPVNFLFISNEKPNLNLKSMQFINWDKEREVRDLQKMDIGIMPLNDDPWSQGKCGFKLIQYMSVSKAVVASPVGVNTEIIDDGINGFLANSQADWYQYLKILILQEQIRQKFGELGRKKIKEYYSKSAIREDFLRLFE